MTCASKLQLEPTLMPNDPRTTLETSRTHELRAYNCKIDAYNKHEETGTKERDISWDIKVILGHKVMEMGSYPTIKLKIQWIDNQKTWEDLEVVIGHDTIKVLKYAMDMKTIRMPGWESVKQFVEADNKLPYMKKAYLTSIQK